MNRRHATTTLAAAIALALAGGATVSQAQMKDPKAETMQRMTQNHLQKCYGVAAKARNDCAAGAHSCAGQATRDHDPASFVLLPQGDCGKIAGGSLSAT